jgi:hypothetical protein
MKGMDDVAEFIRARIVEERADAEAARDSTGAGVWVRNGGAVVDANANDGPIIRSTSFRPDGYDLDHVARQSPAATLARLDALTALVDRCAERAGERSWDDPYDLIGENVLGHLAAIWRDHADYQPAWAV